MLQQQEKMYDEKSKQDTKSEMTNKSGSYGGGTEELSISNMCQQYHSRMSPEAANELSTGTTSNQCNGKVKNNDKSAINKDTQNIMGNNNVSVFKNNNNNYNNNNSIISIINRDAIWRPF